jgi:hypothetical protein
MKDRQEPQPLMCCVSLQLAKTFLVVIPQHVRMELSDTVMQKRLGLAAPRTAQPSALMRPKVKARDGPQALQLLRRASFELIKGSRHAVFALRGYYRLSS